jgi:hypothetical protein
MYVLRVPINSFETQDVHEYFSLHHPGLDPGSRVDWILAFARMTKQIHHRGHRDYSQNYFPLPLEGGGLRRG